MCFDVIAQGHVLLFFFFLPPLPPDMLEVGWLDWWTMKRV